PDMRVAARADAERAAPLRHGLGGHTPEVADCPVRLAADGLGQSREDDECLGPTPLPDRPGDGGRRRAADDDSPANVTLENSVASRHNLSRFPVLWADRDEWTLRAADQTPARTEAYDVTFRSWLKGGGRRLAQRRRRRQDWSSIEKAFRIRVLLQELERR